MTPSTNKTTKQNWLETGYRHFALLGPDNLSINKISKELNASRASFYNYFGDMDMFIEQLLTMHWNIAIKFNNEAKKHCRQLFPDLYQALAKHPIPLQFNIQLFKHRHIPTFNFIFIKLYEHSAKAFLLKLFAEEYDMGHPQSELFKLWFTVGEAWYSRLNPNDLSASTLERHAHDILDVVIQFSGSRLYSILGTNSLY